MISSRGIANIGFSPVCGRRWTTECVVQTGLVLSGATIFWPLLRRSDFRQFQPLAGETTSGLSRSFRYQFDDGCVLYMCDAIIECPN